ncbi:PREDICTED: 3-ketodihydrosphingosine reductase [Ceratosolen solmsi marchali]|uniref:3-dehydrosphinganine reductase n=1 Tax=Ceratosolen solmsi marchali TaxID=326594 RepID=A0AAJ7E1Q4_9HYME|nr:PREDICTED: 3-ketodihydrosphingosine reductase [Ceratosolen solmsi marchali]
MKHLIFVAIILILSIVFYVSSISHLHIVPVLVILLIFDKYKRGAKKELKAESSGKGLLFNKNVIVTGGSSGIGKCVAIAAAENGANVTIIARNPEKLVIARDEIDSACCNKIGQRIGCVVLDLSQDYEDIEEAFTDLEKQQGPCYMLVNCAGMSICSKIEDTSPDLVKHLMNLNFLGSYYCAKAVVPSMKLAKRGKIVFVSSQAGLLGIFGYSAYCATKFALKGLAESLAMELAPYNVSVTLSLPPDTDTPGYVVEEQSKLVETKLISASGGLVSPEIVARRLLDDALDENFFSTVGWESYVLTTLCSGMSPLSSFFELIFQTLLMGPLKMCSAFFHYHFKSIVIQCMTERENRKKIH